MVLDVFPLAVEGVVDHPRWLVLGTVEAALDETADRSRSGLLAHAETKAIHFVQREPRCRKTLRLTLELMQFGCRWQCDPVIR